jgi:hypothetical protein
MHDLPDDGHVAVDAAAEHAHPMRSQCRRGSYMATTDAHSGWKYESGDTLTIRLPMYARECHQGCAVFAHVARCQYARHEHVAIRRYLQSPGR